MKRFVTGTGTEIGKTYVTATLASALARCGFRVAYYKPVQTGTDTDGPNADAATVAAMAEAVGVGGSVTVQTGLNFGPPVAPMVADPEGRHISLDKARYDIAALEASHDVVLVEGAGGLMVPMTPTQTTMDWLGALDMPVLVVALSGLGTLNHTLLTLHQLDQQRIPIDGVVFNRYPANPHQAPLAVQTLLETITPFLPPSADPTRLWTCAEATPNASDASGRLSPACLQHLISACRASTTAP